MLSAIKKMEVGVTALQRLEFEEFGRVLSVVNVVDRGEQQALFAMISGDLGRTTSLAELTSAIAAVSPILLLEDLRDRVLRKYSGDLDRAFFDFDINRCGFIDRHEFIVKAVRTLNLTETEAQKVFSEMDVDGSGHITRWGFFCAIGLSEPSLLLEGLRQKVRQRSRSMRDAVFRAFEDKRGKAELTLEQVQAALLPTELKEREVKVLLQLIDRDQDGALSIVDFVRGVRQFAPSCGLTELRIQCCHKYGTVNGAFTSIEDWHELLDLEHFTQVLRKLGLLDPIKPPEDAAEMDGPMLQNNHTGIRPHDVFDVLDVRHEARASISRLVAALQASGPVAVLPTEELNLRAKRGVRGDFAPIHDLIGELKTQTRHGIGWCQEEQHEDKPVQGQDKPVQVRGGGTGTVWRNSLSCITDMMEASEFGPGAAAKGQGRTDAPAFSNSVLEGCHPDNEPDALTNERLSQGKGLGKGSLANIHHVQSTLQTSLFLRQARAMHVPRDCRGGTEGSRPSQTAASNAQRSWTRVQKNLHASPGKMVRGKLENKVEGYFQSAISKLSDDAPLTHGNPFQREAITVSSKSGAVQVTDGESTQQHR